MKRIVSIFLALTLVLSTSLVSFAEISGTLEDNEVIVSFDSIQEIEELLSELNYNKLKYKESKDKNKFSKQIKDTKAELEKKGAKLLKKEDKEYQKTLKFIDENKYKYKYKDFDISAYSIYVVNTIYTPQQSNQSDSIVSANYESIASDEKIVSTMSSYPGWRMRVIYISSIEEPNYARTYVASSIDLARSTLTTREFFDRAIDVVAGFTSVFLWVPKTILGIDLDLVLEDEIINTYGPSYSIHGQGAFTKKYVQFLDTDNKYNGGYITGAVVNKVDMTTNHSSLYFDANLGKTVPKVTVGEFKVKEHIYYASQVYDIAWNNYLNYFPMSHDMIGSVKFKTEDGAKTDLLQQQWDVWDDYYDGF